ncbi:MAG TPA: hypothetical protein GXZ52_03725 [Clostridiales bacterium]|nr:hypothetical protein [Clostridiales bacterium]
MKIISINDSSQSPFLPYSDTAFFAPSISNDFHNSIISAMMIAELLITLTIAKNSESTISHLNEYEQYFDALEQFCIPG